MPFLSLVTLTLTLTFKLVRARYQTRFPCQFGADPFSGSQDISYSYTNKKQTDGAKNRTFRRSLPLTACRNQPLGLSLTSADSWMRGGIVAFTSAPCSRLESDGKYCNWWTAWPAVHQSHIGIKAIHRVVLAKMLQASVIYYTLHAFRSHLVAVAPTLTACYT